MDNHWVGEGEATVGTQRLMGIATKDAIGVFLTEAGG